MASIGKKTGAEVPVSEIDPAEILGRYRRTLGKNPARPESGQPAVPAGKVSPTP
jgi:hypothetical protein